MSGGRSGRARVCVDAHTPRGSTRGRVGKHARPSACACFGPLRVGWTREQTARNAPADAQPRKASGVPAKRLTESGRLPDVPQTCPRRALSLPPPCAVAQRSQKTSGHAAPGAQARRERGAPGNGPNQGKSDLPSPVRATGGASPGPLARRAHGACAPRDEPCSLCIRGYASTASGGGPRGHEGLASNTRWRAVETHHRPLLAFHHMWTTRRQVTNARTSRQGAPAQWPRLTLQRALAVTSPTPQLWAGPTQRVFLEDGHFNIRCGDVGGCRFVAK